MRYLFGLIFVLALSLMGCSETAGTGGSGGSAGTGGTGGMGGDGGSGGMPECESGEDCDDGEECTTNVCTEGACEYTPVADGTTCDESNESNECTTGMCADGTCDATPVQDGTACGDDAGTCQQGSCVGTFACTEQGIREAIAVGGGPHTFDCESPTTVVAKAVIEIDNDVILDGEGNLTVDGSGLRASWWFSVLEGVTATLDGFTVTGGETLGEFGRGIYNLGTLTLTDSTVSGSTAELGGGIYNLGTLTLTNSTVSGNTAEFSGGGIFNEGSLVLLQSTLSGNTAEDGDALSTGPRQDPVYMTMIARTLIEGDCDLDLPVNSNGYNIESPGNTCGLDEAKGDQINVTEEQLNLGPLADNGGPTMTHALGLLPTRSVTIDQIPAADCVDADGALLIEDQRGEPRPAGAELKCDVGAFERQSDDP